MWQAWNDPQHIMQWNSASDDWHTTKSDVDLIVGGRFCHRMAAKNGSAEFDFEGTYTRIDAPYLLCFRIADGRIDTVRFSDLRGATIVTEMFDAESSACSVQQRAGWQSILENFQLHMETLNERRTAESL